MNKETIQFLEILANKLGTTSEYLWSILLKQAPVSATIDLVIFFISTGFYICYLYYCRWVYKNYDELYREDKEVTHDICLVVFGITSLVLICVSFVAIPGIINGYFNPEFWALDYIVSKAKK